MGNALYETTHLSGIPDPDHAKEPGDPDWHAVRIHFGIQSFGTNVHVAHDAGALLIGEHTETDTKHEELYFIATGRATFTLAADEVDAPAGTFVYVADPGVVRSAVAREPETTVLCFGGTPGEAFSVSSWEQKYDPAAAR